MLMPKNLASLRGNAWTRGIGATTDDMTVNGVLMAQDIMRRAAKDYAYPKLPPAPHGIPNLDDAVTLGKKMDDSRGSRGAPSAFDVKNWGRVKVWVYAVELREYDAAARLRVLLWAWAMLDRAGPATHPDINEQQVWLAAFIAEHYGLRVGSKLPMYFDDHYALLRLHCIRLDHCAYEYRFGRKPRPKSDPGSEDAPPPSDDDQPGW